MTRRVLHYRTEKAAKTAFTRMRKRYPQDYPGCSFNIVPSPSWLYPFRYLIEVTGIDGRKSYWSAAR